MTLILGAHMSMAEGYLAAAKESVEMLHANAMQCFVRSPRGGQVRPIAEADAAAFRSYCVAHSLTLVVHAPYLLNLAKPYAQNSWAVHMYSEDLQRCEQLGGLGVVLHMGKYLDQAPALALKTMASNVKRVLMNTSKLHTQVIIENTAGQGTELGHQFEEIAALFKMIGPSKRLSCCFDTAHAFGAGYDLATEAGWKITKSTIEQTIGWEKVSCIQLNDSKKQCGSKVDRHENIGKGFIGTEGLMRVVKFAKSRSIPLLLETPIGDDGKGHMRDIQIITRALKG